MKFLMAGTPYLLQKQAGVVLNAAGGCQTQDNYLGQRLSEAEWEERKKRFYMASVIRECTYHWFMGRIF